MSGDNGKINNTSELEMVEFMTTAPLVSTRPSIGNCRSNPEDERHGGFLCQYKIWLLTFGKVRRMRMNQRSLNCQQVLTCCKSTLRFSVKSFSLPSSTGFVIAITFPLVTTKMFSIILLMNLKSIIQTSPSEIYLNPITLSLLNNLFNPPDEINW